MVFEDVLINSGIFQQYMHYIYKMHEQYPKALEHIAKFWLIKENSDSAKAPIQGRLFERNFLMEEKISGSKKPVLIGIGEILDSLLKNNSICSTKEQLDACMSHYLKIPAERRLKSLPEQIINVYHQFKHLVEPEQEAQKWDKFWDSLCFKGENSKKPDIERNRNLRDYVIQQMAFRLGATIQNFMKNREGGYYLGFMAIESKTALHEVKNSKELKFPALIHFRDHKMGDSFYLIAQKKSEPVLIGGLGKTTPYNSDGKCDLWVNKAENPEIYEVIHPLLENPKIMKKGYKASFFYYEKSTSSESQSPRQFTASC